MYVCMYVCVLEYEEKIRALEVCVYVCMYVCMYVYWNMRRELELLRCVRMNVCMYLCMYVCMYIGI